MCGSTKWLTCTLLTVAVLLEGLAETPGVVVSWLLWCIVGLYYYIRGKKALAEAVKMAEESGMADLEMEPIEKVQATQD